METRSQVRNRSSRLSNVNKLSDDEDQDSNLLRCYNCDKNITPSNAEIQFEDEWYCQKCIPSEERVLKNSLINQTKNITNTLNNVVDQKKTKGSSDNDSISSVNTIIIISALSVIIIVIGYILSSQYSEFFTFSDNTDSTIDSVLDCKSENNIFKYINNYKDMFPSQLEETWITLATGIHRIFTTKPTEPSSFLLFHKEGDETANCLVKTISKFASECLTGNHDIIDVKSEELRKELAEDSGELMTRYKSKIIEKEVMVVRDINELSGDIVKEFHYLCDTYQPFVNRAIYFFTMSTNATITKKNLISEVEESFRHTWGKSLDHSVLHPLIARMISFVMPVISEEKYKVLGC